MGAGDQDMDRYQQVVHDRTRDGRLLAQVFALGTGGYGCAKYFELIFERERA